MFVYTIWRNMCTVCTVSNNFASGSVAACTCHSSLLRQCANMEQRFIFSCQWVFNRLRVNLHHVSLFFVDCIKRLPGCDSVHNQTISDTMIRSFTLLRSGCSINFIKIYQTSFNVHDLNSTWGCQILSISVERASFACFKGSSTRAWTDWTIRSQPCDQWWSVVRNI